MEYPGHTYDFLFALTKLELTNRQFTLTRELKDKASKRTPGEKDTMAKDLEMITAILKLKA